MSEPLDLGWLVDQVALRPGDGEEVAVPRGPVPSQITEGARNESLASLAGTMRRRGFDQDAIELALLQHNANRCSPPLSNDEVRAVARSVARYEPAPHIVEQELTWGDDQPVLQTDAPSIDDMRVTQFLKEEPPPVRMLVDNLLPAGVVGLMAGAGGVGKTTMITEMAVAMAAGRRIFGHWAPCRPLKTAMLIKEDDREDLWRMVHNASRAPITWPDDAIADSAAADRAAVLRTIDENMRAFSLLGRSTVMIEQDGKRAVQARFMATLLETVARLQEDMGGLDVLFLDPLRRFSNADENDSNAANMLIEALDRIRDEFDVTVIATHHLGKVKDITRNYASRGSSALEDGGRWIMNAGPINEEDELRALGLEVEEGWNRYVKLVNVKNTKMRPAHQVVIERTKEMTMEFVGTVGDLRAAVRPGSAKAANRYEKILPELLAILAQEPGMTRRVLREEWAGVDGPMGVGKDTVLHVLDRAVESGEVSTHSIRGRGGRELRYGPAGWEPGADDE